MKLPIPGFVDLQVNGYRGADFSSHGLTEEEVLSTCESLCSQGTAALLPTIATTAEPIYKRNLSLLAKMLKSGELKGRALGIHLEGPFISRQPGYVGAHPPWHVVEPDIELLKKFQDWAEGEVKLITIAAELPGAPELAQCALELGMVVSVGHSDFGVHALEEMVDSGATAVTHLGNGLPNQISRHHNPIWAALANDDVTCMFIADGHHLPDPQIKASIRAKGVDRSIVVSDLSAIAGQPPGEYALAGMRVLVQASGRITNPERGCLVGSGTAMLRCMNHLSSLKFLTLDELLRVGFYNPLSLMGLKPEDICTDTSLHYDPDSGLFTVS